MKSTLISRRQIERHVLISPSAWVLSTMQVWASESSSAVDVIYLCLPTIGLDDTYLIPLGFSKLSPAQLYAPESFIAIDAINHDLSAVRLGGKYQIPLGSIVLTIAHVHKVESIQAVDLFKPNQQPLIYVCY